MSFMAYTIREDCRLEFYLDIDYILLTCLLMVQDTTEDRFYIPHVYLADDLVIHALFLSFNSQDRTYLI